jgi:transcription initiation factor TFIID TATA-box-binding protein
MATKATKIQEAEICLYKSIGTLRIYTGVVMSEFDVKVENVVVFVTLGTKIPLDRISNELEGAEYAPESFPGVIYRIKEPRAATLIFSSGKIVCTGTRSVDKARSAVQIVAKDLKRLGIKVPNEYEVRVENIVGSTQVFTDQKLSLEDIAFAMENTEYEPESFPGLVYRVKEPRVAFLLFGTGKIICTGARNMDDIQAALVKFKDKLVEIGVDFGTAS